MSSKTATALGMGAILLWATLASLTVLSGRLPPFQTTAIAFAIGGVGDRAGCRRRAAGPLSCGRRRRPWRSASTACSAITRSTLPPSSWRRRRRRTCSTRCGRCSSCCSPALLPGHRLRMNHVIGALLGLAAAALLVWSTDRRGRRLRHSQPARLRLCARLRAGVVELFGGVAPAGRRAQRKPRGLLPGDRGAGLRLQPCSSRPGRRRPDATAWLALAALGAGPVGAAFLLWDIGMKQGDTSLLGVLAYAVAGDLDRPARRARSRRADLGAGRCVRPDGGRRR